MSAEIVRLYPRTMASHGPLRSFNEIVKGKLRAGLLTPGGASAALVVYRGLDWEAATAAVATMMRELADG